MISIIVPTYRKSQQELVHFISCLLQQTGEYEVIISDVGTKNIEAILCNINDQRLKWLCFSDDGNMSRAKAMNEAVNSAAGQILLFLHSDMELPHNAIELVIQTMTKPNTVAGGFRKKYTVKSSLMYITEAMLNIRTSLGKRLVGTNAIFIRREAFMEIKYQECFMEDVVFSDTILAKYRRKRITIIKAPVQVSAERYLNRGPGKAILINGSIMLAYRLGRVNSKLLGEFYRNSHTYSDVMHYMYKIIRHIFTKSKK